MFIIKGLNYYNYKLNYKLTHELVYKLHINKIINL